MDKVQEIIIENEEDTREFGHQLASHLEPGSVVALFGDLGTGKTTLTKYIGQGLGVEEIITSPTFTVIQEYRNGRIPLYHFDVYRLNGPQDLLDLGYEDYFYGQGVTVIEWADKIQNLLPPGTICIHLKYGDLDHQRKYLLEGLDGVDLCGF
jgi:tRNA threonylcarbamoyladenosine biosynthesis protein TsaE